MKITFDEKANIINAHVKRNFTGKPFVIGISTLNTTIRARILDVDGIGWTGSQRILPELRIYNSISVDVIYKPYFKCSPFLI